MSSNRCNISSGAPWEGTVGYSRAVRIGNIVEVAGTTATDEAGKVICPGDAYGQTKHILGIMLKALADAGAQPADVIRTRMFVTDISRWEEYGKAHGEVFASVRPSATMIEVTRLINPEHLIEIEMSAVVSTSL